MTSLWPWTLQEKNENFKKQRNLRVQTSCKDFDQIGIQQPDACTWAELKKNCYMEKIYKSIKFWREKFFFCKYARNSLLGGEIIKWENPKIREKFRSFWKFAKKTFKQKIGVRAPLLATRPSNLHNFTKYEIFTITDIPCKCFTDYPTAKFSEILGIHPKIQMTSWR